MPLSDGYGALIGTINRYYPDNPDAFGKYYHANLWVDAPMGSYHCAVDVDSHQQATGVEWRVVPLEAAEVAGIAALGPGWHALVSNDSSGAIDYVRSRMFRDRLGCLLILDLLLGIVFDVSTVWKKGTSLQAINDFAPLANSTKAAGLNVMVFGEPFTNGLGVHNIHQNQGDPLTSQWAAEDGIWQDGITIFQPSAGQYVAFMNKFTSQSYFTDDQGRPR